MGIAFVSNTIPKKLGDIQDNESKRMEKNRGQNEAYYTAQISVAVTHQRYSGWSITQVYSVTILVAEDRRPLVS